MGRRCEYGCAATVFGCHPWSANAPNDPGSRLASWRHTRCREVRVRDAGNAYRVFYVASIGDTIFVLHCFQKKSRRTAMSNINLGKQRYKQMKGTRPSQGDTVTTKRYASVWDAIEDTPAEAENLKIRSALMQQLAADITAAGMTQSAAADQFGVTQPRISDLMRGKVDLFSIDTLVNMLPVAGLHVDLRIRQAS